MRWGDELPPPRPYAQALMDKFKDRVQLDLWLDHHQRAHTVIALCGLALFVGQVAICAVVVLGR